MNKVKVYPKSKPRSSKRVDSAKRCEELLKNLTYRNACSKKSVEETATDLKPFVKELSVTHIHLALLDISTWRKKRYYVISKYEIVSRLDEWIHEHMIRQEVYADYLEQYRAAHQRGEIKDIDEHILSLHYRPEAIELLSKKKSFDLQKWSKKRAGTEYRRRSHLYWKDGMEFRFDFRNSIQSLFVRRCGEDNEILGIGGFGSSGQREDNTFFTAVFYLLGKQVRIPNHLLIYNSFNELEYTGRIFRPVITPGFGANFSLNKNLSQEIQGKGFRWASPARLSAPKKETASPDFSSIF